MNELIEKIVAELNASGIELKKNLQMVMITTILLQCISPKGLSGFVLWKFIAITALKRT